MDGGVVCRTGVELGEFLLDGGDADPQAFCLAEPAFTAGFFDPGQQVLVYFDEAMTLGGFRAQQGATDAPLTELMPRSRAVVGCRGMSLNSLTTWSNRVRDGILHCWS
jgi:hypothetical protein